MKLNEYIEKTKLEVDKLADSLDVTPMCVYRYLSGKRIPNKEVMNKIYDFTNGEVTPNDFFLNETDKSNFQGNTT